MQVMTVSNIWNADLPKKCPASHDALTSSDADPDVPDAQACVRWSFQVRFTGLTGSIAFDDSGYRTDYKLDVLEMGFNSEPKKVSYI